MIEPGSKLAEIVDEIIEPLERRKLDERKDEADRIRDDAQAKFDAKENERRDAYETGGRRDGDFKEGVFVEPDIEIKGFDDEDRRRVGNCVENYLEHLRSSKKDADRAEKFAEQVELTESHKEQLEELI